MDSRSRKLISDSASLLWNQEDSVLLRGVLLAAWRIIQELKLTNADRPMRSFEIAQALELKYKYVASPETIRQMMQSLKIGLNKAGIELRSNTSRGYWIEYIDIHPKKGVS